MTNALNRDNPEEKGTGEGPPDEEGASLQGNLKREPPGSPQSRDEAESASEIDRALRRTPRSRKQRCSEARRLLETRRPPRRDALEGRLGPENPSRSSAPQTGLGPNGLRVNPDHHSQPRDLGHIS